jgi:hypothetical protein
VLILDDLLFWLPMKGTMWALEQIRQVAEGELFDEQPILHAILENELAREEERIDAPTYDARQKELMAALRDIRERKRAMAEERGGAAGIGGAPIEGKASLEIEADLDGYGRPG